MNAWHVSGLLARPLRNLALGVLPLSVLVACGGSDDPVERYKVGGQVAGLQGAGLVLHNNGADDLALPANATGFSFDTLVAAGQAYAVTVGQQPAGQTCTVSNGNGTARSEVSNVQVQCSTDQGGDSGNQNGGSGGTGGDSGSGGSSGNGNGSDSGGDSGNTGPTVGTGAASDCFNPALMSAGTTYFWHLKSKAGLTIAGTPVTISQKQEMKIDGAASFNGHNNLLRTHGRMDMVIQEGGVSLSMRGELNHYARLEQSSVGPVVLDYGSQGTMTIDLDALGRLDTRTETKYAPPSEARWFTLKPGQSYTHTGNSTSTVTTVFMGTESTETFNERESYTITYLGQTSVTVPAGTFQACRFRGMDDDGTLDTYYAVGSGLPLIMKTEFEDELIELQLQPDSHINGVPVRP